MSDENFYWVINGRHWTPESVGADTELRAVDFARRFGMKPAAVSQLIKRGKITAKSFRKAPGKNGAVSIHLYSALSEITESRNDSKAPGADAATNQRNIHERAKRGGHEQKELVAEKVQEEVGANLNSNLALKSKSEALLAQVRARQALITLAKTQNQIVDREGVLRIVQEFGRMLQQNFQTIPAEIASKLAAHCQMRPAQLHFIINEAMRACLTSAANQIEEFRLPGSEEQRLFPHAMSGVKQPEKR